MHAAIRRVLPSVRQRLARPPPQLRIAPTLRCLSYAPVLRDPAPDAAAAVHPAETTPATAFAGSAEAPHLVVDELKDAIASHPDAPAPARETGDVESTYTEAPSEELVGAAATGDAAGERPTTRAGRPVGTKRRIVRKTLTVPKPVLPSWFMEGGVRLKEDYKGTNLKLYGDALSEVVVEAKLAGATTVADALVDDKPIITQSSAAQEQEAEVVPEVESTSPPEEVEPVKEVPEKGDPEGLPEKGEPVRDVPEMEVQQKEYSVEETAKLEPLKKYVLNEEVLKEDAAQEKIRYRLHKSVWKEIVTNVRAGMLLPKGAYADSTVSTKSHIILQLPKDGGVYFLDSLVESVAAEVDADLVRIEAQDFSEIAGDYLGDSLHSM